MITVLGMPRQFDQDELGLLARADVVAGGARHLAAVAHLLPPSAAPLALSGDLSSALKRLGEARAPVVLASGDPGFFGIVRALGEQCGPDALDVRPAIAAVAAAFARAGLSWDDARVVSAHGRDPSVAVNTCRRFGKVAVLTEPRFGPVELARTLMGLQRRLVVATDLGGPGESVTTGTPAEIAAGSFADPNVVLVLAPQDAISAKGHAWPPRASATEWALDEAAFSHRDSMVTKAEVRALALAWLGPGPGDLVWDIGAGSGAVAVEAARLGAAVIAVERDAQQCERIRENALRHGVPVEVVHGAAPDVLDALPRPDAVFVGGGGTSVTAVAAAQAKRVAVVALATVERVGPALRALAEADLRTDGTQLSAARLSVLPTGHRLAAANPVFVLRGRRGAGVAQ